MEKLETLRKLKKEYDAMLKKEGKNILKDLFKNVFETVPELESIRWYQYTPFFNDGDACTFGIHGIYFKVEGNPENAGDYEDGYEYSHGFDKEIYVSGQGYVKNSKYNKQKCDILDSVEATLGELEEVLQALGDHSMVTVGRDLKIEVEEYEHD
jgi:hypothetical protein